MGWIKTETELPENGLKVRWRCKDGVEDSGIYTENNFATFDPRSMSEIESWQPLPNPPPNEV